MKKSLYNRTLNKALRLLFVLVPSLFFSAVTMAGSPSHKTTYGSIIITYPAVKGISSHVSIHQKNAAVQDTNLKSVAGNSYFSFAYLFQRNSYPNYIPLKAKAAPPTVVCPGNTTANTDPVCRASLSLVPPTINDDDGDITTLTWKMSGATSDLSPVTSINFVPAPYIFNKGLTTIVYTVTDGLGTQASCSFTVTVTDNEPPTLVCPDNANITIPSCSTLSDPVTFYLKEFRDNCGILNFTNNAPPQFPLGTTSVLWTGNDISGNSSQCTQLVNVTSDAPLTGIITNQKNVVCKGTATGSVTVAGNDGTPPYQYKMSGGAFQAIGTFSSLIAGTYSIIIKDANDCQTTIPVTILESTVALTASITRQTKVLCAGQSNGSATVRASGGTSPYTYSWNTTPLQTTATATNLKAQSYIVTVTDAYGCAFPVSVTITEPTPLVVTISKKDVSCFGDSNGTATATTSGGTPPYTYAWLTAPIQSTASIANLPAGTYTVAVFDSLGCPKTAYVKITQPASKFLASITNQVNVACSGRATGSLTVTGSGGTPPYQYKINAGAFQPSGTFSFLSAGVHNIIVMDANNCTFNLSATITEPANALHASITSQANVSCKGQSNGSATVTASGGTSPYTYSWNTTPVQTGATATNLNAQSYIVTVTDVLGCAVPVSITITEPTPLVVTISKKDVSCFGDSNGTATATTSGGTPPYTYAWLTVPIQTTASIAKLPADSYTVVVFDSQGCPKLAFVIIDQPTQLTATFTKVDVVCAGNNGSVTVTGSGGTPPYQYKINAGAFQPSGTFSFLSAGVYNIIVMDANNCTFNLSATITEPANALHASITSQANVLCKGQANGSATITAMDGNAPYTYSWNTIPAQTTASVSNLAAGNYSVTTTDNTGCSVTDTAFITEPALDLSVSVTNQVNYNCATGTNGSITVAGAGGTPNYQYSINGGSSYQINATFTNLPVGNYTITVRDTNNCVEKVTAQIIVSGLILAVNDDFTTQEDTGLSGNVMTNDQVLCNLPITVTSNTFPQHGSLSLNANGTFTYTPFANYNGNDSFNYTIKDNVGGSSTATVSITINPVNDPPVTFNESVNVNYNLPATNSILLNGDYDPEGTALSVSITPLINAGHGTFVITADGSFTYTPNLNYIGNDIVIINVCDEGLPLPSACSADTIFIVVFPPNKPPVIVNEHINVCQGSSFIGTATNGGTVFNGDTDPENNLPITLNSVPVQDAAHGIFTITDSTAGTFNYTPNSYYSGSDMIIVSICDAGIPVECSNDTIFIAVPQAVVANAGKDQTIIPGSTASLSGTATGGSGIYSWDWVRANLVVDPSAQNTETVVLNSGTSLILTVVDITTGCYDTDTTNVFINSTDYTPVAFADYDTTLLNTPVTIKIIDNDINPSGDPLIISFCGDPAHGIVVLNSDQSITYTPNPDYEGDDILCYSLCNANIPSLCSNTLVFIHVKKPSINDLYVYTGISPNGDGKNDVWKIKNIEKYPDNTVLIFNRWGDKLREFANYNNTSRSWDGKNEKGQFLPDGTYFYILEVKNVGVLKGWIYLRGTH